MKSTPGSPFSSLLALQASFLLLAPGALPVCAQIAVLEDFNNNGEGVDYFSTSYTTGSDYFQRVTSNPAPGHAVALTSSAPQGGAF